MARAIVRCSLNKEAGSDVRNQAVELLEANGFARIGTFSYSAEDQDVDVLLNTLRRLLQQLRNRPSTVGVDHVWLYIDKQ